MEHDDGQFHDIPAMALARHFRQLQAIGIKLA
jgi:hypothetical protein